MFEEQIIFILTGEFKEENDIFKVMRAILRLFVLIGVSTISVRGDGLDSWANRVSDYWYTAITASENMLLARPGDLWLDEISTDGSNWAYRSSALPLYVMGLGYGANAFVAVGSSGGSPGICTSTNGVNWVVTRYSTFSTRSGNYSRVAYGGGTFVAVGTTAPLNQPLVCGDGFTWQACSIDGSTNAVSYGISFSGVIYENNLFISVGSAGRILASNDGTNWVSQASGTTSNLVDVAYGGGFYLAIGDVTLVSANGKQWQQVNAIGRGMLRRLAYGANRFVGVGDGGLIQSTTNGIQWVTHNSGTQTNLSDVTFYKNAFYAVGQRAILQSGTVSPLQLQTQLMTSGSELELIARTEPGVPVRVQVSTNLTEWRDWKSFSGGTGSTNLLDDTAAALKFYRLVSP